MSAHEREVIGVDDRVSVGRAIPLGIQHMMSMFGSTVLVPVLTGLNPNVAIMCSGIGTICYLLVTRNKIPSYLGSSFAFISPILAVGATQGLDAAMSGVVVAGLPGRLRHHSPRGHRMARSPAAPGPCRLRHGRHRCRPCRHGG